jgi:lipopolysaccharide/colanic/teichoic acid biosynthesis glycosyltransferase
MRIVSKTGEGVLFADNSRIKIGILIGDVFLIAASFFIATYLRYGTSDYGRIRTLLPFVGASCLLWVFFYDRMNLTGVRDGWKMSAIASRLLLAVGGQMSLVLAVGYLTRLYVSRVALVTVALLSLLGFLGLRYCVRSLLFARRVSGSLSRVVIAGSGRIASEIAAKIKRHPELLCQVVGFLVPGERLVNHALSPAEYCDADSVSSLGVPDLLDLHQANQLIVATPDLPSKELINLVTQCSNRGISVSLVPQPYQLYRSRPRLLDLDGLPVLQFSQVSISPLYLVAKRGFDLLLGSILAIGAFPAIAVSAAALRITRGRAFQWDVRCGQNNTRFEMLRLNVSRTMPKSNGLERLLERFSITELPQLWNVLKGDMSLVGPRPESPSRTRRYTNWQRERLSIKPGITGLAQVHGLREQHSSDSKAGFDLQYLLRVSIFTDLVILIQTIWTLAIRGRPSPIEGVEVASVDRFWSEPSQHSHIEVGTHVDRAQSGTD